MDLKTLHYFTVVAEELNITKAAKILMMSQPPLSNAMHRLEEELHTSLFVRGKRNLTLTEEGKYLYRKAKDILALSDKTKNDILLMKGGVGGTISLGIVDGFSSKLGASWIRQFTIDHPFVHFRILSGDSEALIEKMRLGLISMAIISSPYDQVSLNAFPLYEEEVVAILPKDHPLAEKESLSLSDLSSEPLIVPSRKSKIEAIRKSFRKLSVDPLLYCESDTLEQAVALAGEGLGIAIFPKEEPPMSESVICKKIEGALPKQEYLFVWRKGHQLPTIEEEFIDHLKKKTGA